MSSQSDSVYDDPVETFDKLDLNDSFNDPDNLNQNKIAEDKLNKDEDDHQINIFTDFDKNDYLEDYFNIDQQHKLQNKWVIWYSKLSKWNGTDDFESKLQLVGKFGTVEQFWNLFCFLKRPHEFETLTEVHVFKNGIMPTWENESNKNGGKFIVKVNKGIVSRLWENLLLSVLGEQFLVGDEITGVVLSIRHHFAALCVWNSDATNKFVINHIRETLKRVLNLSENVQINYKVFNQRQPQQS